MEDNATNLVTLFHHENLVVVVLNFDHVWSNVGAF
jgi:hypothetical protein